MAKKLTQAQCVSVCRGWGVQGGKGEEYYDRCNETPEDFGSVKGNLFTEEQLYNWLLFVSTECDDFLVAASVSDRVYEKVDYGQSSKPPKSWQSSEVTTPYGKLTVYRPKPKK